MQEPSWLTSLRSEARKQFDSLPLEKSQYTQMKIDFDSVLKSRVEKQARIPGRVRNMMNDRSVITIVQVDSDIIHINLPESVKKKGVILSGINSAIAGHESLVKKFFEKRSVKSGESKLTAFNFANFSSGVFLHVPSGVEVKEPVRYVFVSSAGSTTISHVFLQIEEGGSVTFSEEKYSEEGGDCFHSSITESILGHGAALNYISAESFSKNMTSLTTRRALVERDGRVNWIIGSLGSRLSKAVRDTMLVGSGSEVTDVEIFFGDGSQHFDITSNINHKVPHTKGNVLVKGVLKDSASSVSQGMIKIDKDAQKTDSFLAEHTLMLDSRARSDAIPGLEIEANDVRATHSASTSQVDREQIFYLTSRGVDEKDAKKLIVLGFLESALQRIPESGVAHHFKEMIEEKWDKSSW